MSGPSPISPESASKDTSTSGLISRESSLQSPTPLPQNETPSTTDHDYLNEMAHPSGRVDTVGPITGFQQTSAASEQAGSTPNDAIVEPSIPNADRPAVPNQTSAQSQPASLPSTNNPSQQPQSHLPSQTANGALPHSQPEPEKVSQEATPKPTFFGTLRPWSMELLACLIAILVLVVEIVLLAHFHNKNIKVWPHDWSINSVFAFLTAVLEAAVAFAVGASMGQLRWLWFQKGEAQLKWMDRLTNARTAPGAFYFVTSPGAYKRWAGVGALLTLALLGVGVFTQNVIKVIGLETNVDAQADPCSVPVANTYYDNWQPGLSGSAPGDQIPTQQMMVGVDAGFTFPTWATSDSQNSIINLVSCATGNCTFGQYSTLSLCTKCADISDTIECGDGSCPADRRLQLPDGSLSLDQTHGWVNITSDATYPNSTLLPDIGPLVARYRAMVAASFPQHPPSAMECALYWCVETFNATATAGNFTEVLMDTWTDTSTQTQYGQTTNITLVPNQCFNNGKQAPANSSNCIFGVDPLTQRALQNYLFGGNSTLDTPGALNGSVVTPDNSTDASRFVINGLAADTLLAPWEQGPPPANYSDFLNTTFTSMGLYMSNVIRSTVDTGPGFSFGTMTTAQAFYHVRWGWLAYPIAIVLIAIVFVLVTVVKSRHSVAWKSSVTALMFHGLDDADRRRFRYLDDPEEMKHATRTWLVSFNERDGVHSFKRTGAVDDARLEVGEELPHGLVHIGQAVLGAYGEK